jgi:hypothetical protein
LKEWIRWVENFDPFFGDGGWDVFLGSREQIVKEEKTMSPGCTSVTNSKAAS